MVGSIYAQNALAFEHTASRCHPKFSRIISANISVLIDMSCLRQSHLASSTEGTLSIAKPKQGASDMLSSDRTYILQIPDELLASIIQYASNANALRSKWELKDSRVYNKACMKLLSLVCHRFRRLAQPLLFHKIHFGHFDQVVPPSAAVIKLHRTMSENAWLRKYCR